MIYVTMLILSSPEIGLQKKQTKIRIMHHKENNETTL